MEPLLAKISVSPQRTPLSVLPPTEPMDLSTRTDLVPEIYQVLLDACSQDPLRLAPAARRLAMLEKEQGSFHAIYQIGAEKTIPAVIREMAMIRVKNEMISHWRSRTLLTDQQKESIRVLSLTFMDEPIDSLFSINALVMAKIARIDFPSRWPTLVNSLIDVISVNLQARLNTAVPDPRNTLILRRALKTLHGILKEIATMKMPVSLQTMGDLEVVLKDPLMQLWEQFTALFRQQLHPSNMGNRQLSDDLEIAHISFKSLSQLTAWRWGRPITSADGPTGAPEYLDRIITISASQVQVVNDIREQLILAMREANPPILVGPSFTDATDAASAQTLHLLTRHIMVFGKLFRRLFQLRKDRLVQRPAIAPLVIYYWTLVVNSSRSPSTDTADSTNARFPVRLLIQCLFVFKEVMRETSSLASRNKLSIQTEFFSKDLIQESVLLLLDRFLPLQSADIVKWQEEPEEWVNAEENEDDAWDYELRPCAERVMTAFVTNFPDIAKPILVSMFRDVIASDKVDAPSILRKEAVYCALGRAVHQLKTDIDFYGWLSGTLIREALYANPDYVLIKRRIAWVIGKWVSYDAVPAPTAAVWQVLLHLLQDAHRSANSIVVRISAAIAIKNCVDTIGFDRSVFEPYLIGIVASLLQLVSECETLESRRRVTQALSLVIERADVSILSCAREICATLPALWKTADDDQQHMLKADFIVIGMKLVAATKSDSVYLWPTIVPLIQQGLLPQSQAQLDEDALDLWIAALRNTATLTAEPNTPDLLSLFPSALSLLHENLDLLGKVLDTTDGYLFIDAPKILQLYALNLLQGFSRVYENAVQTNVKDLLNTVGVMVQLTPATLWIEAFHVSGFFWNILKGVFDESAYAVILGQHLYLLARMLLQDASLFALLMTETAKVQNVSADELYDKLIDKWWSRFDSVAEPQYRKLLAMGAACLVSTGLEPVLKRMTGDIFNLWLDVLTELEEAYKQSTGNSPDESNVLFQTEDSSEWQMLRIPSDALGTLEESRRDQLNAQDPVKREMLGVFIKTKMAQAAAVCNGGPPAFEQNYLSKTEGFIRDELSKLLDKY